MSAFAAGFSSSQRVALQALGYRLLERADMGTAWDDAGPAAAAGSASVAGTTADAQPAGRRAAPSQHPAAGQERRPAAGNRPDASGALPSRVVIEGLGGDAPLLRGILAVLDARVGSDDKRVLRTSDALRVDTGGPGAQWRVHADELRASPRRKAALWRALRQLRREPRG